MTPQTERIFLLDTNVLSPEKFTEHDEWHGATLLTASTSAQELLGMQRPGRETGYEYALPSMDKLASHIRRGVPPEVYTRWINDHAKHRSVSRQTDLLDVPRSRLRAESRELGHAAIAIAHARGQDGLFNAYASRGLRGKKLRRVLGKWDFLRNSVDEVIPLDEEIVAFAVSLANQFVASGNRVKGTTRNTMNDMFVAATSLVENIALVTDDVQLKNFYQGHGWAVRDHGEVFVATPEPPSVVDSSDKRSNLRGNRYVNRPRNMRSTFYRILPSNKP